MGAGSTRVGEGPEAPVTGSKGAFASRTSVGVLWRLLSNT